MGSNGDTFAPENGAIKLARQAFEAEMSDDEAVKLFREAGEDTRKGWINGGAEPHKARLWAAEYLQAVNAEWDRLRSQS